MAKVTGPLMSLDASGSVAKTITFSKWKGRNYVRQLTIPANPQTGDQQAVRTKLGVIAKAARAVLTSAVDSLHVGSAFFQAARDNAPSGQSWISDLQKNGYLGYTGAAQDFAALSGTKQGYFTTVAENIGMIAYDPPFAGAGQVGTGLQLYMLANYAVGFLSYSSAVLDPSALEGVEDFGTYVHTTA